MSTSQITEPHKARSRKSSAKPKATTAPTTAKVTTDPVARWSTKGADAKTAVCRYSDAHPAGESFPVAEEFWFAHKASGTFHVRSRCKACERVFRKARREAGKDGWAKRDAERKAKAAAKAKAAPVKEAKATKPTKPARATAKAAS